MADKRGGGNGNNGRDNGGMKKLTPNNLYNRAPEQVDKFAPLPHPEVDIRQDFGEVVADAIAIGAEVRVYAIQPDTARSPGMTLSGQELIDVTEASGSDTLNPLDTWGVCLSDIGKCSPPFDIARFSTREAALEWAKSRELNLVNGGATVAANATTLRGLKVKAA